MNLECTFSISHPLWFFSLCYSANLKMIYYRGRYKITLYPLVAHLNLQHLLCYTAALQNQKQTKEFPSTCSLKFCTWKSWELNLGPLMYKNKCPTSEPRCDSSACTRMSHTHPLSNHFPGFGVLLVSSYSGLKQATVSPQRMASPYIFISFLFAIIWGCRWWWQLRMSSMCFPLLPVVTARLVQFYLSLCFIQLRSVKGLQVPILNCNCLNGPLVICSPLFCSHKKKSAGNRIQIKSLNMTKWENFHQSNPTKIPQNEPSILHRKKRCPCPEYGLS